MSVAGAGRRGSRVAPDDVGSRPQAPALPVTATSEADTPAPAPGRAGAGPGGGLRRRASGLAGLALLAAVAAGLLGQGAYYAPVQRYVGLLVAAATVLALAAWPPARGDVRLLPVVPALALAAWALLDAALLGVPAASAGTVLELIGGVGSLTWEGQGILRASSTLSYPNATAAVLVAVAMLVLARLVEVPRSLPLVLSATGLLAGLAATMSRAGALGLAVGLVVLAGLRGPGRTARAAVGPYAGAVVALGCLLPSMPVASPPRPVLALAGLSAGLALAAVLARLERWPAVALLLGGALLGGLALVVIGGGGKGAGAGWGKGGPVRTVAEARVNLASPDRSGALRAAVRVAAEHPLTGAGPGHADLRWKGPDGVTRFFRYAHDEYVQVAAELGLVGLALLAVLLVAVARLL